MATSRDRVNIKPINTKDYWELPTIYYRHLPARFSYFMQNIADVSDYYTEKNTKDPVIVNCKKCDSGGNLKENKKATEGHWVSCDGCGRKKFYGRLI